MRFALAYELQKDLAEIDSYSPDLVTDWFAFFAVKAEKEKKARQDSRGSKGHNK